MSGTALMRLWLLLAALFFAVPALARANVKSAGDYFHGGAYKYVAGKQQEALVEVEEGLRHYPDDKKLQSLAGQLRKLKDQQDPKNQDNKGDDKKKDKDGKDKQDPNKDKDKDKKDGDKKPDEDKDKDKDKKDGQNPDPKDDGKDKPKGKNPAGAPPPGQMSEEEAKRLLNSFADDEKKEQRERQKLLRKRMETDQDW
jgi:Ca-activated chloride channel family protein